MNKYEWLWKSLKQHKQGLVDKFNAKEILTPAEMNAGAQHKTVLDLMNYLELKEPENNKKVRRS